MINFRSSCLRCYARSTASPTSSHSFTLKELLMQRNFSRTTGFVKVHQIHTSSSSSTMSNSNGSSSLNCFIHSHATAHAPLRKAACFLGQRVAFASSSSDSKSSNNNSSSSRGGKKNETTSSNMEAQKLRARTTAFYAASVIITFIGLSFAAVPLYQLICSTTGIDGTPQTGAGTKFKLEGMQPSPYSRTVKITFDSSVSELMPWKFLPETRSIKVKAGDTALAFFRAENKSEEAVTGISTYSVIPYKAAQYFNKIQCFCFEEQRLEAGEEVDMPVFFFIDPEFNSDPWMKDVNEITLHYTFFKSKTQDAPNAATVNLRAPINSS